MIIIMIMLVTDNRNYGDNETLGKIIVIMKNKYKNGVINCRL